VIVPWSSSAVNVWDQPATIAAARLQVPCMHRLLRDSADQTTYVPICQTMRTSQTGERVDGRGICARSLRHRTPVEKDSCCYVTASYVWLPVSSPHQIRWVKDSDVRSIRETQRQAHRR
jgi:hypothetical protein